MIDPTSRDEIAATLQDLQRAWNALDFALLRGLWDPSREPIYFAEEAPQPRLDWQSLQAYWDLTARTIARMGMRFTSDVEMRELAPGLVSVVYAMHWDALVVGQSKAIGGENRVCATLRRTKAGWKFVQYVEAPLAPITYVKWLYERSATPGFGRDRVTGDPVDA
jgi:hypothetical protein